MAFVFLLLVCSIASVGFTGPQPLDSAARRMSDLNSMAARSTSANPAKALEYGNEALKLALLLKNPQAQSIALLNIGLAHLQLGNLSQTKYALDGSLVAAQQAGYRKGMGDAHNFLGTYYWEEGLFDQAHKHYTQAVAIRAELKDRIAMSKSINNLGQVQRKIGNYEKAIDHYQESLAMKGTDDASGRTNTLVNLALVYKEMRDYEKALRLLEQALDIAKQSNYLQGQAFARRSIGETQLEMQQLPEALTNLLQAAEYYELVSYRKGTAFAYASIGQVYEGLGNFPQALSYYEKAIGIAEKIEQRKLAADLYYYAARVARTTGDSGIAFGFYEKSITLSRQIAQSEMQQRMLLQQISYEAEQQQLELDKLKLQTERQDLEAKNRNNLLFATTVSLLIIGVLAAYLRRQLTVKHAKELELLAVTERLETAQEKLRQMVSTDHLTAIANRRFFDNRYRDVFAAAIENGGELSVIMADIDWFKPYNDIYGHQPGDHCLQQVARTLKESLGDADFLLARYGGEEFVLVASLGLEAALALAEQARQNLIRQNIAHTGSPYGKVTFSFGVATLHGLADATPEKLLKNADEALYLAKTDGRNCVRPFQ
jgi:diguanylate cyclase (GGDEF)-like protein